MAASSFDSQQAIATSPTPAKAFQDVPRNRRRRVFFRLSETVQQSVIEDMSQEQLHRFIRRIDPDEATDVLQLTDEETQAVILRRLDEDRRERIGFLLDFDPETTAGMMNLNYITLDASSSFDAVAQRVRRYEERIGRFPTIFITDGDELLGELPSQALAMADRESVKVTDHIHETPTVRYDRPDTDALEVFRANPESMVAVLDTDDSILGVIDADDILRVIDEEASETLYEFTGVAEEESVLDGPLTKIRSRYKWLVINLGTAFMAAAVVGLFESTIAALAVLAAYMPVVAGMGGNAGTQTMAVTVRGISLEQVSLATGTRAIVNEVIAGAANGLITGVLVAAIATVFNQSPLLGLVIGVSMVLNLIIAGFFGALIPLVLDRLGQDPATSATIFITTATDVLGFFAFLGLAQVVLL
ncbi:magnesium transporter [Halococcus saccharolyticus]|nr:magnesium transporter [Halococcus saccharolyticus]